MPLPKGPTPLVAAPVSDHGLKRRLQQMRAPSGGLVHGLLAVIQVVEHRRVGAGKFAAPMLTGLEQGRLPPTGQRSFAHPQQLTRFPGRGPLAPMTLWMDAQGLPLRLVDQLQPADCSSGARKARGMACHAPAGGGGSGDRCAHVVRMALGPWKFLRTFCAQLALEPVFGAPQNP